MASGDDPLADMQNILGYQGLVGPNPYSPFQNAIPFSGGAGPGVGFIAGWPTDAMGNPIQPQAGSGIPSPGSAPAAGPQPSVPGTTINSNPAQSAGPNQLTAIGQMMGMSDPSQLYNSPAGQQQVSQVLNDQMRNQQLQAMQTQSDVRAGQGGFGNMPGGAFNPNPGYTPSFTQQAAQPQAAQPAASGAMGPSGLTRQQYLSLLANPGPAPTYGAAPPQAGQTRTGTPAPNVMQAFLATQGGKNTPFVNTLNKLQGATA